MQRRLFLSRAGAAGLSAALVACGGGGDGVTTADTGAADPTGLLDDDSASVRGERVQATAPYKSRVIVVGGGMAGATVAKYLRRWGDAVEVILIERERTYRSCILSSLVLTAQRKFADLAWHYDTLRQVHGVKVLFGDVVDVDPVLARVKLADGRQFAADRLVLAPGIDFDAVPGLDTDAARERMPHAWKAGPQTLLLARQLQAMPSNGTMVLTIPKAPYRCPPGPYERACLIADWMKTRKPRAKLLVLDANADIVAEHTNFTNAFLGLHGSVIEYRPSTELLAADASAMSLVTSQGTVSADVINLIPRQRAGRLAADIGLATATEGRFVPVDVLSYASAGAPRVHVIGDASATTQPKAGHIANQEAKVCADAIARILAGGTPHPAPVTNSACYSTITMRQASWLTAVFQYDPALRAMVPQPAASGESDGWDGDRFEEMTTWYRALMTDTFG